MTKLMMDQRNNRKAPRDRKKLKYKLRDPYNFYMESLKKKGEKDKIIIEELKEKLSRIHPVENKIQYSEIQDELVKAIKRKKETKKFKEVSYGDFRKINYMFNQFLGEELIKGKTVKFPGGIGLMFIYSRPIGSDPRKYMINWGHWQKTGQIIRYTSEHSNFMDSRFYWRRGKIKGVRIYKFITDRGLKKALSEECKKGRVYIEIQEKIVEKRKYNDLQTGIE